MVLSTTVFVANTDVSLNTW